MSRAIKCPCGHRTCTAWMVDPEAAVQGVLFTEEEAMAVADFLNRRHARERAVQELQEIVSDEKFSGGDGDIQLKLIDLTERAISLLREEVAS